MTNEVEQNTQIAYGLLLDKYPAIYRKLDGAARSRMDSGLARDEDRHPLSLTRVNSESEEILQKIETGNWTAADHANFCERIDYNSGYRKSYYITVGGLLNEIGADLKNDLEVAEFHLTELKAVRSEMSKHHHIWIERTCGCTDLEGAVLAFALDWANRLTDWLRIVKIEIEAARVRVTAARKLTKRNQLLDNATWDVERKENFAARVVNAQQAEIVDDVFEGHRISADCRVTV